MYYMVTYQKSSGEVFFRRRKTIYDLKIGEETSMGWKVIDIHYLYEGNWYHYCEYRKLLRKHKQKKFILFLINQLKKIA